MKDTNIVYSQMSAAISGLYQLGTCYKALFFPIYIVRAEIIIGEK